MMYILNMLLLEIFGSVNNYMGMITVGLFTACLLHTSEQLVVVYCL